MRIFLTAIAIIAVAVSSAAAARAQDPAGEAVLDAAARALGAGHLKDVPSLHIAASGKALGLPATFDSYGQLGAGGSNAVSTQVATFSYVSGYDGQSAWTRDQAGVVWVDGSQQGHAAAINEAYRESYTLWTPSHGGAAVALLPPQSDGGHTYDVVKITPAGSVIPFDVWIDRATHLPARYVETAAAVTTTTLLSNYHAVSGIQVPFETHQSSDQGNQTDSTITHVDIAPPDLSAKLRKPETDVHDYSIAGGSTTSVPFDLIDNHVYLDVMLNGKGPYRFVFDTGGQNVVDPAVVREIGAGAAGTMQGSGVGATTEQFSFAAVKSLRVGAAELRDQLFIVGPVRTGFGISGSAPVDGIIGAEVLARFVTVFDYAQHRVTLEQPATPLAGTPIPFVFDGTQPVVACTIAGIAARCSIDSGSRASLDLLSPFIADHPGVVPADVSAPGVDGFGVGGAERGRLGRLPSLEIGGFDLKNLIAGFSGATAGAFAVPGIGANVGGGVLKRFTVTYDYPHQTLSLIPNRALFERDSYDRSGLFVVRTGGLTIADVRPGTPAAEAGIVKGDAIVSIDGKTAEELTLGDVRERLRRPAGTRVQIGVLDKGATAPHVVTLTLRDYV